MKPETYIKKYSATVPVKELARRLGRSTQYVLGKQIKLGCRPSKRIREKFRKASLIKKGNVPFNKGKKVPEHVKAIMAKSWFAKGHQPHNTKKDGVVSIRTDTTGRPYKYIRLSLGKWKEYHVYRWEKFRGPVPKGMLLRFKDGDSLNCNLSNLELIDRTEHMLRNTAIRRDIPIEIIKTKSLIKKLRKTIHEKQNH